MVFVLLIVLPFIDRSEKKRFVDRPIFTSLGLVFVAELAALTYWGYVTPGAIIPNEQAALVLGGIAIAVVGGTFLVHELLYRKAKPRLPLGNPSSTLRTAQAWTCAVFVVLVGSGAMMIGGSLDAAVDLVLGGVSWLRIEALFTSLLGLGVVVFGTIFLLYRLDLGTGLIKKRVRILEVGWEKNEAL